MKLPRSTIEQWLILQTVIDQGSFAKAAEKLHKSQSAISYTISTLQDQLGIELLSMEGRRAVLTETGKILLNRSREISRLLSDMEQSAQTVKQGYESNLTLVIDALCPREIIFKAMRQFEKQNQETKLDIRFEILSGPVDALTSGEADLIISPHIPKGYLGENFIDVTVRAYAHMNSPLHRLPGKVTARDLKKERYLTIRDKNSADARSDGWFGSEKMWRLDSFDTVKELLLSGIGFAWMPEYFAQGHEKILKPLTLSTGGSRVYRLHIIQRDQEIIGPARKLMIDLLLQQK